MLIMLKWKFVHDQDMLRVWLTLLYSVFRPLPNVPMFDRLTMIHHIEMIICK